MVLTLFDYIVLSIMLFFTFFGLIRGFVLELFSLVNWIGSGLFTVLLRPIVNEAVSQKISNVMLSNIVSSSIVFIVAIIGLSILTSHIAKIITTKFPSSINITLGLAFGFIKGFLISSLIFISILNIFGSSDDISYKSGPKWLQNSETYKPLSFGAYILLPFANSTLGQIKQKYSSPDKDEKNIINKDEEDLDSLDNSNDLRRYKDKYDNLMKKTDEIKKDDISEKKEEESKKKGGYKKDQVDKLNHLINIL